jgi:hypothetical protein
MVGLFSCRTSTSVTIPRASALGGANARSHARQAFNSRVRFCSKRCADKPHAPRAWDWQTRRVSPHEPMWTLPPELPNKHRQSQRFDNSDRSVVTSTRRNSGMRSRVGSPALQATSWGFFSSTIRATSKQRTRPEHLRSRVLLLFRSASSTRMDPSCAPHHAGEDTAQPSRLSRYE